MDGGGEERRGMAVVGVGCRGWGRILVLEDEGEQGEGEQGEGEWGEGEWGEGLDLNLNMHLNLNPLELRKVQVHVQVGTRGPRRLPALGAIDTGLQR